MTSSEQFSEKYRIMSEINMVPLIDVALVLLIIFMVMTPILLKSQIKINLPSAGAPRETGPVQGIAILIDQAGKVYLNNREVSDDQLGGELKRLVTNPETQPVLIEADKSVQFEHVVTVMDIAKRLGILKINVSVKPTPKPGKT